MTTPIIRSFKKDFQELCRKSAGRRALLDIKTHRVWTYGALFEHLQGFAALLEKEGVSPGEKVFSLLPNSVEQLVAFLATLWYGADFCPISPLSTPAEAARFVAMARCVTGFVPTTLDKNLAGSLNEKTSLKKLISIPVDGDLSRYNASSSHLDPAKGEAGKLIIFTSGTTSAPKALVILGDRLWSAGVAWKNFHSFLNEESRFYNILPMSYLGGLFNLGLIPLACGGSVVLDEAFSAATALRFWQEVEQNGVNLLWFAPTMLRTLKGLYKDPGIWARVSSQVRAAFLGMSPTPLGEKEEFERLLKIPLLENFALSETTFLTSETLESRSQRIAGSVGEILPWVDLRPGGTEAVGELEVKTPFLFEGNLTEGLCPEISLTEEGFYKTGDLGEIQKSGTLILRGRNKDVVKKGGYLVILRDLEDLAQGHPAVLEAVAVRTLHPFYGESPVLCLQIPPEASSKTILEGVKNSLIKNLAKFRWPTEIVAMNAFPKSESGKTRRALLEEWVTTREKILDSIKL